MPELTVPGLVLISLLPFAVAALWEWRQAARQAIARSKHSDRLAVLANERAQSTDDRELADWNEGTITNAAVEAVLATEEWAKRGGQEGLIKTEYATTYMSQLLDNAGIKVPHEGLVHRIDAALSRVRPALADEPQFVAYEPNQAGQEPSPPAEPMQSWEAIQQLGQAHRDAAEQSAD